MGNSNKAPKKEKSSQKPVKSKSPKIINWKSLAEFETTFYPAISETLLAQIPASLAPKIFSYHPDRVGRLKNKYQFKYKIELNKDVPDSYTLQRGMVVHLNGEISIVEAEKSCISTYDCEGRLVGSFTFPSRSIPVATGLALQANGNFVFSNTTLGYISLYRPDGALWKSTHPTLNTGICAVTTDMDDKIYAPDPKTRQIFVFSSEGKLLMNFAHQIMIEPRWVSVAQDGRIFVTDATPGANRILIFTPAGKFLDFIDGHQGGLSLAACVVDLVGNVVVTAKGNRLSVVSGEGGELLRTLGGEEVIGNDGEEKLGRAWMIAISPAGELVLFDMVGQRIIVWGEAITEPYLLENL